MNHTDVKVGTQIVAKVGCNEVKAIITGIGKNGIMARSHKSGKEFRVKTILQVESAPEVIRETPKQEKKLSLFSATIFVYTPVQVTGFFVFSPTNHPQKTPLAVSGMLSSTPRSCKTAQLLRFFGNLLCHPRNLTQYVTYYKSTLVYYNIPGSFSQTAIHTRRDANRSLLEIFILINWRILCAMTHLCLNACANMTYRQK